MKILTILLSLLSFALFSQNNFPNYSSEMFNKDTACISKFAVNLPIEKQAELYALASYWAIEIGTSNIPDTIDNHFSYSRKDRKKEIKKTIKTYLNQKNLSGEWVIRYYLDINQDSKLDIIEITKYSEDTLDLWFPNLLENNVYFYISTSSKYYNLIHLPGRLNTFMIKNNEYYFTSISYSCCDEGSVTRVCKLHIPIHTSKIIWDNILWAHGTNSEISQNNYTYFPKTFNTPKYYMLNKEFGIESGVYGPQGRMFIEFFKNDIVRIISESKDLYFVEFKILKDAENLIDFENIYMVLWIKKSIIENIATRLD